MTSTKDLLDRFIWAFPNSWHHLDEWRFNDFVISSFHEWKIYSFEEIKKILKNNPKNLFTEEQAINFANKYIDYIELLKLFYFRQNNNWNFDILNQ